MFSTVWYSNVTGMILQLYTVRPADDYADMTAYWLSIIDYPVAVPPTSILSIFPERSAPVFRTVNIRVE